MNIGLLAPLIAAFLFWSEILISVPTSEASLRCMIQMVNYDGEGAYVVVGLVDSEGNYLDTLYVLGDDEDWYYELEEWWKFFGRSKDSVDGITGPTLGGGERTILQLNLQEDWLDRGYGLRFETGVENEGYFPREVVIPLTSDLQHGKHPGEGFIRYVRLARG